MRVEVDFGGGLYRIVETRRLPDLSSRYQLLGWGCRHCRYYEAATAGGAYGLVAMHSHAHSPVGRTSVASYTSPRPSDMWDRLVGLLFGYSVIIQCDTCYTILSTQDAPHDCHATSTD